ncbi:MAG: HAMP domain-containing sensor histidine kinase [Actinomycetota bacterium]
MSRVPIRLRLTLAFAVAVAVVLAATSAFLFVRLDRDLQRSIENGLRSRAQELSAALRAPGARLSDADRLGLVERGESVAQVLAGDGAVVDGSRSLGGRPLLTVEERGRARRGTVVVDRAALPGLDEPARLLATPIDGGRVLVVGTTLADRDEALAGLRQELLIGGPAALVLLSLAGYAMAGAALRPVEAMRRRAAAVSAATPGARLPVPPAGDEIARLGVTLNDMLARLEAALARERRLVADAGHELRTPLSLLKAELELTLAYGGSAEELEASLRSAMQEADRLAQLADNLLLLAQADGAAAPDAAARVDVAEVCATVARRFAPHVTGGDRSITVDAPDRLVAHGDHLRLEQAVANLVDNAVRHGGGAIRVAARRVDGRVEVHVLDEGPGVDPGFAPRAFEPFSRADGARDAGGAGLGLAIARSVARACGGDAHLAARPGGGADVWLDLPAAPLGAV